VSVGHSQLESAVAAVFSGHVRSSWWLCETADSFQRTDRNRDLYTSPRSGSNCLPYLGRVGTGLCNAGVQPAELQCTFWLHFTPLSAQNLAETEAACSQTCGSGALPVCCVPDPSHILFRNAGLIFCDSGGTYSLPNSSPAHHTARGSAPHHRVACQSAAQQRTACQ
jgi:hypothetical protein